MKNDTAYAFKYGIDIAKDVFQLFRVDQESGEVQNFKLKRKDLIAEFINRGKCLIGMEACGSSQYWARELQKLGHTVRLMDPKAVKPFVTGYKSDRADAQGIYTALINNVREVAVKNDTERDLQTLLTMRELLVKQHTAAINHVRGLLYEYGIAMPISVSKFQKQVGECINELEEDSSVSRYVISELRFYVERILAESARIDRITDEAVSLAKATKNAGHLLSIPGVGVITMAYMSILLADPSLFKSGRQFAAFLGLVPMHTGSGGKTITTHIPSRCNKEMRALLVQCAHSVMRSKKKTPWIEKIIRTKPKQLAAVAVANRLARQCWAVASKSEDWKMPVHNPATA